MKYINRFISVCLSVVLLFIIYNSNYPYGTVYAAAITSYSINGTNVNVRSGPGTEYPSLGQASYVDATYHGTALSSKGESWYELTVADVNGKLIRGYVISTYVSVTTYNPDASFEEKLMAFPESYRNSLRALHAQYPNWVFVPEAISTSFWDAVYVQSQNMRKQVSASQTIAWRSMEVGCYNWTTNDFITTNGGWYGASREVIAYYMDPRNFLNNSNIYMFLSQSYNSALQTQDGVKTIIKGTFLENTYYDAEDTAYGGSYLNVIMAAANESGVSPYIIASKIIQEQGVNGTSGLISGTTGYGKYFNFMNWGASGSDSAAVIANGITYAKNKGWTTRSASIIGGAKLLSDGYIKEGQDTYYYQDFNVKNPNKIWHQYAQAVHDAYNKGSNLAKNYKDNKDYALTFTIPVFQNMPASACEKPNQGNQLNNYYFASIEAEGLTPSFDKYIYEYTLSVSGNSHLNVSPVKNAVYVGNASYPLKAGDNIISLPVKSQTGYTREYNISVYSATDGTLYVSSDGKVPSYTPSILLGDTNFDGVVDIVDLAKVQMHILRIRTLSGNGFLAGDTNYDNVIDIVDLAKVQMHILKIKKLF